MAVFIALYCFKELNIVVGKMWFAVVFVVLYIVIVALIFHVPVLESFIQLFVVKDWFVVSSSKMLFTALLLFPLFAGGVAAWLFGRREKKQK